MFQFQTFRYKCFRSKYFHQKVPLYLFRDDDFV